jgi:chemotaxis protein CheX
MTEKPQLHLDQTLAEDISRAVIAVMHNTFNVTAKLERFEIGHGMVSLNGDVSGVIGIVQSSLEGTMTLCFNFNTMRLLLPRAIGKNIDVTQDMAIDAVGEITNMIFGQVKTDLNQRGFELKLGIPSVVTGRGHFLSHFHRGAFMIIPFSLEGQIFQLHVAIHKSNNDGTKT